MIKTVFWARIFSAFIMQAGLFGYRRRFLVVAGALAGLLVSVVNFSFCPNLISVLDILSYLFLSVYCFIVIYIPRARIPVFLSFFPSLLNITAFALPYALPVSRLNAYGLYDDSFINNILFMLLYSVLFYLVCRRSERIKEEKPIKREKKKTAEVHKGYQDGELYEEMAGYRIYGTADDHLYEERSKKEL